MSWPLSPRIAALHEPIQQLMAAEDTLPGLAILSVLLDTRLTDELADAASAAPFEDYCVWSPTGDGRDLRRGFTRPDPAYAHLSVHQRCRTPLPAFDEAARTLGTPQILKWLSSACGVVLDHLDPRHVLTRWPAGGFLGPHTDAGGPEVPVSLVLSISLTRKWDRAWGGATVFSWEGSDRRVVSWPQLGQVALFRPHPGSLHWVERIHPDAPSQTRHTWTLHYR